MTDLPCPRSINPAGACNWAAYNVWQKQAEGIDTVQGRVESSAGRVLGHTGTIFGTGPSTGTPG